MSACLIKSDASAKTVWVNLCFLKIDVKRLSFYNIPYFIEYSVYFFYMENDAEIFPAHFTWKVAEKGFKMACMMNKLAMIKCCDIIL